MYLSIEQDKYRHVAWFERMIAGRVVSSMQRVVGFYQSYGDDPATAKPGTELEWAVDQLHVAEEGEEPPSLSNPEFSGVGLTKSDDRKKLRKAMDALDLRPGPTYTIA
eukprot:TRINITY_DN44927_c0_g1_i1.p2 TRINITY_DN44927_c0_g1~~TRINITY_DN44927_c0_g1_i1.p2  ORF type:complete len:108 (-),score=15.86 TRINITY_DN44927_c0_g1_i1:726-1049(-)